MRSTPPSPTLLAARAELLEVAQRHMREVDALEILAMLSHLVGQCIAVQDQRTVSPRTALDVVYSNIERGNAEMVAQLADAPPGGSA